MGPVYMMATASVTTTRVALAPTMGAVVLHGGPQITDGIFYGGANGPLLYGGSSPPGHPSALSSSSSAVEPAGHGSCLGMHPLHFYKLEFMTYDDAEDP
jgi:hypothetical protein